MSCRLVAAQWVSRCWLKRGGGTYCACALDFETLCERLDAHNGCDVMHQRLGVSGGCRARTQLTELCAHAWVSRDVDGGGGGGGSHD